MKDGKMKCKERENNRKNGGKMKEKIKAWIRESKTESEKERKIVRKSEGKRETRKRKSLVGRKSPLWLKPEQKSHLWNHMGSKRIYPISETNTMIQWFPD